VYYIAQPTEHFKKHASFEQVMQLSPWGWCTKHWNMQDVIGGDKYMYLTYYVHLVGIKRNDLCYKYFILNYKPCCNIGNICILNMAEQINDANCISLASHSSWHHDVDDTHVTMNLSLQNWLSTEENGLQLTAKFIISDFGKKERRKKNGTVQHFGHTVMLGQVRLG
jgi:hypothetical protein